VSSKHNIDTQYLHIDTWSIPGDKKPEVHMFDHIVSAFTAMLEAGFIQEFIPRSGTNCSSNRHFHNPDKRKARW
jgi:hypothetical protein